MYCHSLSEGLLALASADASTTDGRCSPGTAPLSPPNGEADSVICTIPPAPRAAAPPAVGAAADVEGSGVVPNSVVVVAAKVLSVAAALAATRRGCTPARTSNISRSRLFNLVR